MRFTEIAEITEFSESSAPFRKNSVETLAMNFVEQ